MRAGDVIGDLVDDLDEIYCEVEGNGKKGEVKKGVADDTVSVKSKHTEKSKDMKGREKQKEKEKERVKENERVKEKEKSESEEQKSEESRGETKEK